jgi:hypothetical protein
MAKRDDDTRAQPGERGPFSSNSEDDTIGRGSDAERGIADEEGDEFEEGDDEDVDEVEEDEDLSS